MQCFACIDPKSAPSMKSTRNNANIFGCLSNFIVSLNMCGFFGIGGSLKNKAPIPVSDVKTANAIKHGV